MYDVSAPRQHLDQLKRGHYLKLPTYVADFKGFAPYAHDLRKDIFRFHKKFVSISRKLYQMMIQRAKSDLKNSQIVEQQKFTTVSIHIRLTDFENHLNNLFNVTYATTEYFSRAMQFFTDRYKVF